MVGALRFELRRRKDNGFTVRPRYRYGTRHPKNLHGAGTENRTLVNRLKAYYFTTKLYPQIYHLLVLLCYGQQSPYCRLLLTLNSYMDYSSIVYSTFVSGNCVSGAS